MAETLGSLCDKLTILKLKQFHSNDFLRQKNLRVQESGIKNEIDQFVSDAAKGLIPLNRLSFKTNKIFINNLDHF